MRNSKVDLQNMNIVIVTHGLAIRLFLMRWFQYSVDDFEETYNPTNGSLNIMERHENEHGEQWFEIENETKKRLNLDRFDEESMGSLMQADLRSALVNTLQLDLTPSECEALERAYRDVVNPRRVCFTKLLHELHPRDNSRGHSIILDSAEGLRQAMRKRCPDFRVHSEFTQIPFRSPSHSRSTIQYHEILQYESVA